MAYDNVIARTDAQALILEQVSSYLLGAISETSAVMKLAKKLPNMSTAQTRMPVMSALATAAFVNGDSGVGQTTEVSWANKYIDAEPIAAYVPVPKAVVEDAGFDIWNEVKPEIATAIGVLIDAAIVNGTNIPSTWATNLGTTTTAYNGLVARANAASQVVSLASFTDAYEAINGETPGGATHGLQMLLEADGFMATGGIAHTSMRGAIRNCRTTEGMPIFQQGSLSGSFPTDTICGVPILYPMTGFLASASCKMLIGDWTQLVYSIRRDFTFEVSDVAVLTDAAGNITHNLWQQNEVALKVTGRLGFALPNRINRMNQTELTRCPFAVLTD